MATRCRRSGLRGNCCTRVSGIKYLKNIKKRYTKKQDGVATNITYEKYNRKGKGGEKKRRGNKPELDRRPTLNNHRQLSHTATCKVCWLYVRVTEEKGNGTEREEEEKRGEMR